MPPHAHQAVRPPEFARFQPPIPPVFTGDRTLSAETWLETLKNYNRETGRQDQLARSLRSFLTGIAGTWYRTESEHEGWNDSTPDAVVQLAFLQRFGNSPAKSALARAELAAFRQGVLSVDAFADEVERRSSDIKDITLKEKQFFFLNGLNPYYLQHVTLGQETFEGMRQQAREAELKNRMSVNATVVQPSAVPPVASTATPFIPVTAASVATPVAAPNQTPRVTTMQTQDVDTNMDTSVATLRKHEYYDSGVDRQEALVPKRPRLFHPRPPLQFDQDQRNNDRRRGLCYICHQPNHLQRNCPHNTAARHPRPYYYPRPPVYPMVNSLTGYTLDAHLSATLPHVAKRWTSGL